MRKKKWLSKIVCAGMVMLFTGCGVAGSDAEQSANNTEVMQEAVEETGDTLTEATDETEDAVQSEEELAVETMQTESIEEIISEESKAEMVDFETWAKQEGNEEVCLVVWNEGRETQKILEPKKKYIVEEGDRFAVPYRDNIVAVNVEREKIEWENLYYVEVELPYVDDGTVQVDILVFNTSETEVKSYLLANE